MAGLLTILCLLLIVAVIAVVLGVAGVLMAAVTALALLNVSVVTLGTLYGRRRAFLEHSLEHSRAELPVPPEEPLRDPIVGQDETILARRVPHLH